MAIANYQIERYNSNKEKKKVLELRLLHLRLLNDGKNDPKIEKEINYIQRRVDSLDRKIKDSEAEAA
jgi:hypothetical protein